VGNTTEYGNETIGLRAAVYELLSQALNQGIEGRNRLREPFLAPVFIQPEGESGPRLTGFSRDVSAEGIGLLHSFPLNSSDDVVVIPGPNRKPVKLQVKIAWCKPFGEGWYISGGKFVARIDP
jgi:hypothetical protein